MSMGCYANQRNFFGVVDFPPYPLKAVTFVKRCTFLMAGYMSDDSGEGRYFRFRFFCEGQFIFRIGRRGTVPCTRSVLNFLILSFILDFKNFGQKKGLIRAGEPVRVCSP